MRPVLARLASARRSLLWRLRDALGAPAGTFADIYRGNLWRDPETASGPGSTLAATAHFRTVALPALLERYGARIVLDAGCGDGHWAPAVAWPPTVARYVGVDIVPEAVAAARATWARALAAAGARLPEAAFHEADITRGPLPVADFVLCRQALIHLSNRMALAALAELKRAAAPGGVVLLTTVERVAENRDIVTGSFRPLNLGLPPFSLPAPLERVRDTDGDAEPTSALYRGADLPG